MYKLIFDEEAIKYLEKLPKSISKRIFLKLQICKTNPHRYFERLVGRTEYKLRVGDYRVIADINDSKIVIVVVRIGHRKRIYK
jgi:mRNA interferase RelE/StbE